VTRLLAVLGYSERSTRGLHPVCAERLALAARISRPDDVVLFSGWSRTRSTASEAEAMARAWAGSGRRLMTDRGARTTAGNAIGIARAARMLAADEVVVVTSSWHAARARRLVRAALGSVPVVVVATHEPARPRHRLREAACWPVVPLVALAAGRGR
jgi:uncharacterized SAM-binding protein YcdF (DUF218 family)